MEKGRHLNHPSVQRSWSDWSEEATLYVAVAYSNPFRWRTRRVLLENFRRQMSAYPNVQLYIGELAYGDRPHEVTGIDPTAPSEPQTARFHHLDVQLRTDTEMFHKENILNAIVRRWPSDWKYGAYIDGDMIFTRHDWALEAIHLLQHYDFVQLFSGYTDLSSLHEPFQMARSFAWNFLHQQEFQERWKRLAAKGGSYGALPKTRSDKFPFGYDPGAPGGAWAFRRSAFDMVGGFLDINILGAGDSEMAHGLIGAVQPIASRMASPQPRAETAGTPTHREAVLQWQKRAQKLPNGIGYLEQHIVHPFHGSKNGRKYFERWEILRRHNFNPFTDLVPDWQGIYRWSGDKPRLRDDVRKYFLERNEDNPNLSGLERPMF